MNKVMLFYGESFYPLGGWEDFGGYFDTVEAALHNLEKLFPFPCDQWAQVVLDGKLVCESSSTDDYSDAESKWNHRMLTETPVIEKS